MERKSFGNAIVIGGSMAGLLAARVLADYFETVTVIERDERSDGPSRGAACRRVAMRTACC
jgi:2-polyprenyl-6-methoxyphenol hydroxylase-like FAD-dependent oxidoreductase